MKLITPEISWHNRDPIYSIDFQYNKDGDMTRLVTSGTDKNIRIWRVIIDEVGQACTKFIATLTRHTRAVNAVRFSPNGEYLASGGDDSVILLWQLSDTSSAPSIFQDEDDENLENWCVVKSLRGHIEDIYDLSWSADSNFLISGSVDNSAILWDVKKAKNIALLKEHKSFVQGVAWDPLNQYVATLSCDRCCRIYNINTKQCIQKMTKLVTTTEEGKSKSTKLFHDDSMKSFFRRLCFSPDGELLITPAGCIETGGDSVTNTSYIFTRGSFSRPALYLPVDGKASLVIRCSPVLYELRKIPRSTDEKAEDVTNNNRKEWEKYQTMLCLPYRVVFAVATEDAVLLYDSQQAVPFLHVTNIHYHQLSDLAWSSDGRILAISSTDGYCSFISFQEGELGTPYKQKEPEKKLMDEETVIKKLKEPTESKKLHVPPVSVDKEMKIGEISKDAVKITASSPDVKSIQKPPSGSEGKRRVSLITLSSKSPSKPSMSPPPELSDTNKDFIETNSTLNPDSIDSNKNAGEVLQTEEDNDIRLVLELSEDEVSQSAPTQEDTTKRRIRLTTLSLK